MHCLVAHAEICSRGPGNLQQGSEAPIEPEACP